MNIPFDALVAAPPSGRSTALLIDHSAYGSHRLLGGAAVPWEDPALCAGYFGTAQALLNPDATLVDVGAAYQRQLVSRPDLRAAMGARNRTGFALKTLLADADAAEAVVATISALAETSRRPLVLQIPSPVTWLATTHRQAGRHDAPTISLDHAEAASIYLSDWLRHFGALPVTLALLDGRAPEPGSATDDMTAYTPLANLAAHYRWSLALLDDTGIHLYDSGLTGAVVPQSFWYEQADAAPADFWFTAIPADADPELVLAKVKATSLAGAQR